jgi:hypothetical protein
MLSNDDAALVARAVRDAIEIHRALIVSASAWIMWSHPALQAVIDDHPEVIFIETSGNERRNFDRRETAGDDTRFTASYPPRVPGTTIAAAKPPARPRRPNGIMVGGLTMAGQPHNRRGYGPGVDVAVPSGDEGETTGIPVLSPGSWAPGPHVAQHAQVSSDVGVSFGIPLVANLVAKMRLINRHLPAAQIIQILIATSDPVTKMINPQQAMDAARTAPPPLPAAPPLPSPAGSVPPGGGPPGVPRT